MNSINQAGAQPKKRSWIKIGCLGVVGFFVAMIALGLVVQAVDPEGVKRRAAERAAEQTKEAEVETNARLAEIEEDAAKRQTGFHCLSSWDGSHRELVDALKSTLREPDSFEHVETRITPVNEKGFHVLMMNYRARNGFGGMNIGRLAATVKSSDCSFEVVANVSD
jgi:hypothetical protein